MKRNDFPNDWPAYLTESMLFTPITSIAPVGSSGLLFKEMHEYQFEQFCWFLLQKDHYLKGCQQLGVRGTKQEGIDIFASDKFNASQLIVFECKCWKKFKRTELIEAIDKFTASPWIKYKPQFILILAQDGLGSLSKTWLEQSGRLNKIGIKSDVWTGRNLTERIQHFPDIVTRFFGAQNAQYVSNGETEWHIFDRNDYALKVLTNKTHPDFDFGYHSIFYARDDLEGANFGNSTVILWKPPDSFDRYEVANRKWMPCKVAFEWLTNKLLPRVKVWRLEQKLKEVGIFKRASTKKSFESVWDRDAEICDLRQIPLLRGKRYWKVGLLETILQLQYSTGIMRREIYLTKLEVKNIFEALLLVLSFKLGRVTDIASNLSIGHAVENHDDIIIFLRGKLEKDELAINMLSLRYLLSAFLAALNDNDDFLSQDQKKIIFQAMIPIMADQDKRQLFQRHSRWID